LVDLTDGPAAGAGESPPHRGDGRDNGVYPVTGGRQSSWLGEIPRNHGGTKLEQSCVVGLGPYQTPQLTALFEQQADNPAT
jgi:hypothetical protein